MIAKPSASARAQVSGRSLVSNVPRPVSRRSVSVQAAAPINRREVLQGAAAALLLASAPAAQAAKAPSGFSAVQDTQDAYQFLYPFGWQEVSVSGADVVYKDVVEPLESVSVTLTGTEKNDITEFGEVADVTDTLARSVLTAPGNKINVINSTQRDFKGRNYYEVEFTADNGRFTRHQLAVVAVANGKFYTLTTGSSEKRWGRMKDKLQTTIRSFQLLA